jgi:hypothetical protein
MAIARLSPQNGDRVAIVGGGPAGSFFAITLLREARRRNRHLVGLGFPTLRVSARFMTLVRC